MPGPVGPRALEVTQERVVDRPGREGEVQREQRTGLRRAGGGQQTAQALPERIPVARVDLEPRRSAVAPVANQEIGAGLERGREVVAGGRAARRTEVLPHRRRDDGRQPRLLREPPRHEADDPDRPRAAHEDRAAVRAALRLQESTRLVDGRSRDVPPDQVGGVERRGVDGGLGRIVREQERGCHVGVPDAAGGVQPRREREPDRLERDVGGCHARSGEQRRDPRPRRRSDPLEAQARDPAVLAEHRGDVRDGPDRRQVGQVHGRRLDRDPGEALEEQRGDLERNARPGQPGVRVAAIWTVRVDDRNRGRHLGRHPVVIRDDDVDPGPARGRDLGAARAAHVHGDDQPPAAGPRQLHGAQREPVAVFQAAGHVPGRVDPQASERPDHDRHAREAVRVEIADDKDSLAPVAGAANALHHDRCVGKERRVVQRIPRGPEEAVHLVQGDPPRRHHPGKARRAAMRSDGSRERHVNGGSVRVDPAEARLDHGTQDGAGALCGHWHRLAPWAGEATPPGRVTSSRDGPVGRLQRRGGAPPTPPRR